MSVKNVMIYFAVLIFAVAHAAPVLGGTISISLGSYDTEIYMQESVNMPVTITASNITGNVDVTLTPKSGLGCDTCTLSKSFSGGTNEQDSVTFTLTGTQTGNYNPPFVSISAISGSTTATPISSGSQITVTEKPTWILGLSASDTNIDANTQITLTLDITPSGTFQGVSADLSLPSGWTLISGSDPRSIGTLTGASSYQWIVKSGTSAGTKTVSVGISAADPVETASENTESVSVTVGGGSDEGGAGGGGGGGAGGFTSNGSAENNITGDNALEATLLKDYLNAGQNILAISDSVIPITLLDINMKNAANRSMIITLLKLDSAEHLINTPAFDGKVYAYMEINMQNLSNEEFNTVGIKFKVLKTWFAENNVLQNDIRLYRYADGSWQELSTSVASSSDATINYLSVSPGFSYFAIAEKPVLVEETSGDNTQMPDSSDTGEGTKITVLSGARKNIIFIVALLIILAAIIFYGYHLWQKKRNVGSPPAHPGAPPGR